jgi:hypothetical protein
MNPDLNAKDAKVIAKGTKEEISLRASAITFAPFALTRASHRKIK